jgi:hypothetical protein
MNSFEGSFEEESNFDKKKKVIEEVASELKEEFDDYNELKMFIDYLKCFQEIMIEFPGDINKLKKEYIKIEIGLISDQSKIDPEVLNGINDRFKSGVTAGEINSIVSDLLKEYADKDCQEFIMHLGKIYILFIEEKEIGIGEMKEKILEEKINELSSNGEPPAEKFKEILARFNSEMKKRHII